MIQLSGEDTRRLGKAILARSSVKIPGGTGDGASELIGIEVGGAVGTSVFGLLSIGGVVTETRTLTSVVGLFADGGGSVLTTGRKAGYIRMPYAGIITSWTLLADVVGDIVLDVWKRAYASFPPTVADTITAAAKPTISANNKASGSPTGWTTTFTADDVFAFSIDSVSTITQITLELKTERT